MFNPLTRALSQSCHLSLFLVLAGLLSGPATAVESPGPAAAAVVIQETNTVITVDRIAQGQQRLREDTTLSETQRNEAQALYTQAGEWLQQYQHATAELARLRVRVADGPERLRYLTARQSEPTSLPVPVPEDLTLDQLRVLISQEQAALEGARKELKQAQEEIALLQSGASGIGNQLTERTRLLSEITASLQSATGNDPPTLAEIRRLALEVRRQLRQAELNTLKLELGNLDLLLNLDRAEQDYWRREIKFRQNHLAALQQAVQHLQESRAQEAVSEAEQLRTLSSVLPEPLQAIAEANADYRRELQWLVDSGKDLNEQFQDVLVKTKELQANFDYTRQRATTIGPSVAVGRMLLRRRTELPRSNRYRQSAFDLTARMDRATERQLDVEDIQLWLSSPEETADRILDAIQTDSGPVPRENVRQHALEVAAARRETLQALQTEYGSHIGQLARLRVAEQELLTQTQAFDHFLSRQIIWCPTGGLRTLLDADTWTTILIEAGDRTQWSALKQDLGAGVRSHRTRLALLLALFVVLRASRRAALARMATISRKTRRISTDSFLLTLRALCLTVVIAAPWPLLALGLGWGLHRLPDTHPFSMAVAQGFLSLGIAWASVGLLLAGCRNDGLAARHLQWSAPVRKELSTLLSRVLPAILPLAFIMGAIQTETAPDDLQPLGQLAFVALMLVIAGAVVGLWSHSSPIRVYLYENYPNGWRTRLHFIWYPILVGIPLALAVTTLYGYHYTALGFALHLSMTTWLVIGLLLARDLLLRWFYIAERRLRLQDALRRRDEQRAKAGSVELPPSDPVPTPVEEPELGFNEISEQSQRLVGIAFLFSALIGTWSIWSDLIPALDLLNQIALPLSATRIVDGIPKQTPVTLGDLEGGLLVLLITLLCARNLPGLMEVALLRRLPLSAGGRYATTTLSQYAIVAIGLIWSFKALGLEWSSIKWLVAALGVGVGFGLQEIVANFISGIILLFEQPIRIGDVVTAEGVTGTVSRIRIRATTITNWERQEFLIPNKVFVTGSVLNWTLSNKINRRLISVGVAYGTDVIRAMNLMVEAAREAPAVLDDPPPFASFEEFGNSALILRLRIYLPNMDNRLASASAVNQAIMDKFEQAGIVIAFPQQDVHLDLDGWKPPDPAGKVVPTADRQL